MNTQILEYMIAISEEKSMSRAAARLLVSQPALSQQVKKLEKELDAKLFVREKNRIQLTDAGRVYVNGARSVLSIYENAMSEIARLRESGKKRLTLVYNNALLPVFTTRILPVFTERHRDIFISTIDGNASVAKDYLTGGLADLAVMATRELSHSMLEYIPLYEDELTLALPLGHPAVRQFKRQGVDFSCLEKEYFILNQGNSHFRTLEREILERNHVTPNVLCEISDLHASVNMVRNKKGVAFLPKSMDPKPAGYVRFSLDPPAVFHVVAAYHKSIVLSEPLRDMIMVLLREYDCQGESACSPEPS
ncbi:MAG: LysR family transcriptional regulator [Eubacteriales bacterium]|nr:LysR family transcriptional regulator [Eubacteriales bacterium]